MNLDAMATVLAEVRAAKEDLIQLRAQVEGLTAERDHYRVGYVRYRKALEDTPENIEAVRALFFGADLEPQDLDIQAELHAKQRASVRELLAALHARVEEP